MVIPSVAIRKSTQRRFTSEATNETHWNKSKQIAFVNYTTIRKAITESDNMSNIRLDSASPYDLPKYTRNEIYISTNGRGLAIA